MEAKDAVGLPTTEHKKKRKQGKSHGALRRLMAPCRFIRSSIRAITILVFFSLVGLAILAVGIETALMGTSFLHDDIGLAESDVHRVSLAITSDALDLKEVLLQYSFWDDTVFAVQSLMNGTDLSVWDTWLMDNFFYTGQWNTDLGTDLIGVYSPNGTYLFGLYFPPPYHNVSTPMPEYLTSSAVWEAGGVVSEWAGLLYPPGAGGRAFIASRMPVLLASITDSPIYGYLVWAREFSEKLEDFSDAVPVCLAAWMADNSTALTADAQSALPHLTATAISEDGDWYGTPYVVTADTVDLATTPGRKCPGVPLYDESQQPQTAAGYLLLSDGFPGHPAGPLIRVDHPTAMRQASSKPLYLMLIAVVVLLILNAAAFSLFLDLAVLRRLERLKKFVLKTTKDAAKAGAPTEGLIAEASAKKQAAAAAAAATPGTGSGLTPLITGNTGGIPSPAMAAATSESALGAPGVTTDEHYFSSSDASSSSASSSTGSSVARGEDGGADEIENLRNAVKTNIEALRHRIELASSALREETKRNVRHRDALRLLNLWCGRKTDFPGLRAAAHQDALLRPRTIEDLLSNPLSVEFLKAHCRTEDSLESVLFLLDVAWLEDLEQAEDAEENEEQKRQLHEAVAAAASALWRTYISKGAPQEINISSATKKRLRGNSQSYERGMFTPAATEVRMTLGTDILMRFQASLAYAAMCEILAVEAGIKPVTQINQEPEQAVAKQEQQPLASETPGLDKSKEDEPEDEDIFGKAFHSAFSRLRARANAIPTGSVVTASPATATSTSPSTAPQNSVTASPTAQATPSASETPK